MKKWVDEKRWPSKDSVDDLVLVKILPQQLNVFHRLDKGLIQRYEGPFKIVGKVGNIPTDWTCQIHLRSI